jgi:hypothetical protein
MLDRVSIAEEEEAVSREPAAAVVKAPGARPGRARVAHKSPRKNPCTKWPVSLMTQTTWSVPALWKTLGATGQPVSVVGV